MNVEKLNISTMAIGEQFTLSDDDALAVKYIRTLETTPKKSVSRNGQAVEPQPYAQMRLGSISFTINTPEDIAIVDNAESRADIFAITLEVTEFEQPELDAEGNVVTQAGTENPVMVKRRGLAFVDLQTIASRTKRKVALAKLSGQVKAEELKWSGAQDLKTVAKELKALMEAEEAVTE